MPSPQQVMEHLPRQEIAAIEEKVPGNSTPGSGTPVVNTPVADAPVPDTTKSIITGFGILFFILLFVTMYTVASLTGGNSAVAISHNPVITPIPDDGSAPVSNQTVASVTPMVTPVIISSKPATPQPAAVEPAAPRSYVTLESVPVTPAPVLHDLSPSLPLPDTSDFFTIYSLNNYDLQQRLPYVSFNLVNPPLVIEYTVTPMSFTDVKDMDYKIIATVYHEKLTINRPYEQSFFRVVIRDRDTGRIVLEDGYGITYGQISSRQVALYKSGNYRFEFTGDFATIDLTMKVKKEGNIE